MQYSVLGPTGVKVSRICLGTATFGVAPSVHDADRIVGTALDLGINFVDTADVYGNMPVFDRPGAPPPTAANPPSRSSAEPCQAAGTLSNITGGRGLFVVLPGLVAALVALLSLLSG